MQGFTGKEEIAYLHIGVNATDYGTLGLQSTISNAIVAIGSAERDLRLPPGTWSIISDLTIPSNITLKPERGAVFSIATTKTLTINGGIDAGLYQIFSCVGTGKVVLNKSIKDRYLEWWLNNTTPGTTDMSSALQAAFNCMDGGSIYLADTYLISSNITIPYGVRVYGPGKIKAAEWVFPTSSQPPTTISATGTLGTGVSFGSTIAIGTTSFTVANSFAAGDLILLSNSPASQAVKRNELLIVSTSSGSAFTTTTGVLQTYSDTTSLQFQKVTPVENIHFDSVNIENVNLEFIMCRNYSVTNSRIRKGFVSNKRCSDFVLDFKNFDAEYSGCLIDIQGMCRNFTVTGNFTGGVGVSGNATVKTNGAAYYNVNANINGTINGGGTMSAFLADTYYASNPSGYDYQLNAIFTVNINSSNIYGAAIEISGNDGTIADIKPYDFYCSGQWGANGANLKHCSYGVLSGSNNGSGGYLVLEGTDNIIVLTDTYKGVTLTGTNTNLQGVWQPFTATISGTTGSAPEPTMTAAATGRYKRLGRSIEVRAIYDWSSAGSRTGSLKLNMPVAMRSTANLEAPLAVGYTVGLTVTNGVHASILQGTSYAIVYNNGATQQAITSSGTITINGSYEIGY